MFYFFTFFFISLFYGSSSLEEFDCFECITGVEYCIVKRNGQWWAAREYCWESGGHLAIILDEQTQSCVEKKLTNINYAGAYLVGIRNEYPWTWQEGSRVQTYFWTDGEPSAGFDSSGGTDKECIYLKAAADYGWCDIPCDNRIKGSICKTSTCRGIDISPEYKLNFEGNCYVFILTRFDWMKAWDNCNSEYGGLLASVTSEEIQNAIVAKIQNTDELKGNKDYWIGGLQNTELSKTWQYEEGSDIDYSAWYSPSLPCDNDCGECAFLDRNVNYKWNSQSCSNYQIPFICQFENFTSTESYPVYSTSKPRTGKNFTPSESPPTSIIVITSKPTTGKIFTTSTTNLIPKSTAKISSIFPDLSPSEETTIGPRIATVCIEGVIIIILICYCIYLKYKGLRKENIEEISPDYEGINCNTRHDPQYMHLQSVRQSGQAIRPSDNQNASNMNYAEELSHNEDMSLTNLPSPKV